MYEARVGQLRDQGIIASYDEATELWTVVDETNKSLTVRREDLEEAVQALERARDFMTGVPAGYLNEEA